MALEAASDEDGAGAATGVAAGAGAGDSLALFFLLVRALRTTPRI